MKIFKTIILVLLLFLNFSLVNAQDSKKIWSYGLGLNVVDFPSVNVSDISNNFEDFFGFNDLNVSIPRISAARAIDKGFTLEMAFSHNSISEICYKLPDTVKNYSYSSLDFVIRHDLNNIKFIRETSWFDPYVQLGFGGTILNDESYFTLNPGYGFNFWHPKDQRWGINLQSVVKFTFAKEIIEDVCSQKYYFHHSLGLVFRSGVSNDKDSDGVIDKEDLCIDTPGLKEFGGCPDSDLDGVVDSEDACPNLFGLVDFEGCPDADGDSIIDTEDACPDAAGLLKFNGCPDADGDGIIDRDDFCQREYGPAHNNGCPLQMEEETLKLVNFDLGKYYLTSLAKSKLDYNYNIISKSDTQRYRLNGHTDNSGSDRLNSKLSIRRAETVKDYLVAKGFDGDRLEIEGFSYKNPMTTNKTVKGRAQNRRVAFELLKINEDLAKEGKVYFRVQVASGKSKIKAVSYNFNGIPNIKRIQTDGLYKYYIGKTTTTYKSAKKLLKAVKRKGYPNAFIVAFKEGRKIPISKAVK